MMLSAIIVAAGSGTRLGAGVPKAFVLLGGKPLFLHALTALHSHPAIQTAVVVVPDSLIEETEALIANTGFSKKTTVIAGGKERWQSVASGVTATSAEWVLIHDAARPFVTKAVIDRLLEKCPLYSCVITVTPEVDTIRTRSGDIAGNVIDRSTLVRVGTPQLFRRQLLVEALATAAHLPVAPTDEAMLMQNRGIPVGLAEGDPKNFKITTPEDLVIAEALLAHNVL